MTLLNTINVGGTDYKVAGVAILGSCATPAGSEVKVCTFTDNFELEAGDMLLVKFTYANTYGDGSTTYPKLQVNGTNYVMRRADGNYVESGEWGNNATLTFLFDGTDFILPAGSGSAKGSGVPLGAILAIHSNQVPDGYLPCNGVQFDTAQFAALYALLGDDHTPDLREVTLVGIGQNATDTIAAHDVYTLGQFKDDQMQMLKLQALGSVNSTGSFYTLPIVSASSGNILHINTERTSSRIGDTTHGKQKGVNYIIKATSGLPDDQQDYILNQLAPVDVVEEDNLHAVTSNAVAEAIQNSKVKILSVTGTTNSDGFLILSNITMANNVILGGYVTNINDTTVSFSHYINTIYAIPKGYADNKLPNTYVELKIAYI